MHESRQIGEQVLALPHTKPLNCELGAEQYGSRCSGASCEAGIANRWEKPSWFRPTNPLV